MGKFTGVFDDEEPAPSKFAGVFDDEPEERSWGGWLDNVGTDAGSVASNFATAVSEDPKGVAAGTADYLLNPITYLKSVKDSLGNLGVSGEGFDKKKAAERIYNEPVQAFLDASSVMPPTGINPLAVAGKAASKVGAPAAKVAKYAVGETSGMGPQAVAEAYRSGRVGGAEGQAFRSGMRGDLDSDAPVDVARDAVDALKADRKAEYLQGKETWKDTPGAMSPMTSKRLAWDPIEAAFESTMGIKKYRGKSLQPSVDKARGEVRGILDEWKADPGSWTPEGFDALKQRLYDYQKTLNPLEQGAARSMVGATVHAVKRQIAKQAPDYAKAMKAYEQASHAIEQVQKTLTGTSKTSYDTALRKLQSVLRNNAFTNYSARAKLADLLAKKAPELMPMLSGMAANTWTPRGLVGKALGYSGMAGAGVAGGLSLATIPGIAGAAAVASPRIVGEVAHGLGRARKAIGEYGPTMSPMVAYLLSLGQEQ
jgi:hypothetical protein